MLAWLRDLTSPERRTMLACWGGWTLDGFDQQLYSYVVPTVIAVWSLSTGAAGTIGTVTVVTSSFGGWFAGALADRFGRVRMLQIAILWYSVFTFRAASRRTLSSYSFCAACTASGSAANGPPARC
jgi:MFS family permease